MAGKGRHRPLTIDLMVHTATDAPVSATAFGIEEKAATMLAGGLGEISLTLQRRDAIKALRTLDPTIRPWLYR